MSQTFCTRKKLVAQSDLVYVYIYSSNFFLHRKRTPFVMRIRIRIFFIFYFLIWSAFPLSSCDSQTVGEHYLFRNVNIF